MDRPDFLVRLGGQEREQHVIALDGVRLGAASAASTAPGAREEEQRRTDFDADQRQDWSRSIFYVTMQGVPNYELLARLLREEAARAGVPSAKAEKMLCLAEYFDKLAAESRTEISDARFKCTYRPL